MRVPEAGEHRGADHVEHDFLNRAGLEPRRARDHFWTGLDLHRHVGQPCKRRPPSAGDRDPESSRAGGLLERTHYIARTAAGADSDNRIVRTEAKLSRGGPAQLVVVLRLAVRGDMSADEIRRDAKGGRTLGRL